MGPNMDDLPGYSSLYRVRCMVTIYDGNVLQHGSMTLVDGLLFMRLRQQKEFQYARTTVGMSRLSDASRELT